MENIYDVIVIGAGPAGSTAGIYLGRYAKKTLVIGSDFGSLGNAGLIENWPGTSKISGIELFMNFQKHAKEYNVEFLVGEVENVKKTEKLFEVIVNDKKYLSKVVILANGTKHRELGIPGEKEFTGKGVSYCVTCDGAFFKNKNVIVIGGADSAAKGALYLSEICKKVTIIYRKSALRCEKVYFDRILKQKNIEIIYDANPIEFLGNDFINKIRIKIKGGEQLIDCDGVFVEIGTLPCDKLSDCLNVKVDGNKYIEVDRNMQTNIPGVFAAGDITNGSLKQIVTASAEGAIAAYSAQEYLQRLE